MVIPRSTFNLNHLNSITSAILLPLYYSNYTLSIFIYTSFISYLYINVLNLRHMAQSRAFAPHKLNTPHPFLRKREKT
jgi:hypothetical protein